MDPGTLEQRLAYVARSMAPARQSGPPQPPQQQLAPQQPPAPPPPGMMPVPGGPQHGMPQGQGNPYGMQHFPQQQQQQPGMGGMGFVPTGGHSSGHLGGGPGPGGGFGDPGDMHGMRGPGGGMGNGGLPGLGPGMMDPGQGGAFGMHGGGGGGYNGAAGGMMRNGQRDLTGGMVGQAPPFGMQQVRGPLAGVSVQPCAAAGGRPSGAGGDARLRSVAPLRRVA